jgi:hypothetical protein
VVLGPDGAVGEVAGAPLEPAPPEGVPEVAPPVAEPPLLPAAAPGPGVGVLATWRSPRTSMSTRRSGCRQEMSFWPVMPLH